VNSFLDGQRLGKYFEMLKNQMTPKRWFIVLIGMFLMSILLNHLLLSSFKKETIQQETMIRKNMNQTIQKVEPKAKTVTRHESRNPLVPEDPSKYGIVSLERFYAPKTQAEWDAHIEKIFKDSQVLESQEGKNAIAKMATTEKQFNKTVEDVDKEIVHFEEERRENPFDEKIENRLQTLYKLKALSKVMKDKVTTVRDNSESQIPIDYDQEIGHDLR
jgi:hypothetical protein